MLLFCRDTAAIKATPTPTTEAWEIGNAYVEQYYSVLHEKPDQLDRFYYDSSIITRHENRAREVLFFYGFFSSHCGL